ncbi:hypothetical protein FIBSPDRAFT_886597 [Athelia psychrophila]|uniref:Uncharacterized protein n=1 Tax=Athelia psychrophila TaxID=1759441 RepID=A0A166QNC5_9AGAM|nr:hypothetical protein FIBSPDRAFT_886597 [Fibularhizoctonia sp. CBS 109695]
MDAGIRACNAAHRQQLFFRARLRVPRGGLAVTGACGAPTRRDSRKEAVLRVLGGRGSRTVDWDGAVAAGASVRALARHWQGVRHRGGSVGHRVGAMLGKWDCERGGWSAQGAESHPVAALIHAASTGTAREARECLLGFRSERARGAAQHKRLERGGARVHGPCIWATTIIFNSYLMQHECTELGMIMTDLTGGHLLLPISPGAQQEPMICRLKHNNRSEAPVAASAPYAAYKRL